MFSVATLASSPRRDNVMVCTIYKDTFGDDADFGIAQWAGYFGSFNCLVRAISFTSIGCVFITLLRYSRISLCARA